MICDLSLSQARQFAREYGGTYRKVGDWRYDHQLHEFVHESSWTYFDWHEYLVWKNQK